MPIKVTEKWSERRLSNAPPWNAFKMFEVTGTRDEAAALTAVDPTTGLRCHAADDGWTPGNSLVCEGPRVASRPGLEHWLIGCAFSVPPTGTWQQNDADPLLAPIECIPEPMQITEPTDRDLDGRLLMNAAGDIYTDATQTVDITCWTFRKNYPFWNQVWFDSFQGRVNKDPILLAGVKFSAQHACCLNVRPEPFNTKSKFVTVSWTIAGIPDNLLGPYPWQHRFVNVGRQGWYSDGGTKKKAPFTMLSEGGWQAVTEPVLLSRNGLPLDDLKISQAGIRVGEDQAPAFNPTVPPVWKTESNDLGVVFNYFVKRREADFSGIPL